MRKNYEAEGTIKEIMDAVTFDSGFTKREFVVTDDDDRFPQDIKYEVIKDKVALLDEFKVGDRVKVVFNTRGNNKNSTGRYFVNLNAWKIEAGEQGAAPVAATNGAEPDDLDVLPF